MQDGKIRILLDCKPEKVEIIETVIRLMQEQRIKLPRNGAEELKLQLQEQERDLTQSGMIRFVHPSNAHDDLFWAFCIGVYGIKQIIARGTAGPIIYTKNWETNYGYDEVTDFSSLLRPGVTVTDVAIWMPTRRNTGQNGKIQEPNTLDISLYRVISTTTRWKD